jgi:large subunit ribosomal protein L29
MAADPKIKELRQKDAKELEVDLRTLQDELFKLRFQSTTEKVANPARIGQVRHQIARVLTIQRQRELAASSQAKSGS